jgi:methylthioribose-1-phosphate isomerase
MIDYYSLKWIDGKVRMIDQRLLPQDVVYLDYTDYREVAVAIRDMVIRGAPAIGAAAGYALALAAYQSKAASIDELRRELEEAALVIKAARPTAVNLFWAVDRVMAGVRSAPAKTTEELMEVVFFEADTIAQEDIEMCRCIGLNALSIVPDKARFIHHCNTGALATVGIGSALGIIRTAHEAGKDVFVYVDETRPRLQGARLTAWELKQLGIPHAVIADGASGYVMKYRGVDIVTVGCDRIAANGDVANKIGTYNLALVAKAHGVPFYSVGPTSTIDLNTPNGDGIEIEERDPTEVTRIGCEQIAPEGTPAVNPAFDVTPHELLTGIITEEGIAYPPFDQSLAELVAKAQKRRLAALKK